ncbi:methyltransferase [Hyalangium sp.]|uniref:methyltransferase n=1 Tax=Hyalangium sp. TaxID=2028555 RepID=UPI002D2C2436|nr:methyltransferase [Hyalangium sp.]HYH99741.1 methyltransferase [Hyalangium sp.]
MEFRRTREPAQRDRELMLMLGGAGFFQALVAAHELGLFRYLAAHPGMSQAALAEGLGLPPASLRVLLLACCAMKLVERTQDGEYRNLEWVSAAFAGERPSFTTVVEGFDRLLYQPFSRLTESLRRGTNLGLDCYPGPGNTLYERLAAHPPLEAIFHAWMSNLSSSGLPERLTGALHDRTHVLDVGGGDGTNAVLLAKAHPGLKVTILDLPSICERARARAAAEGLDGRISTHPCDIRTDPFPTGADAILFSRIFNIYSEEQNRGFVRRSADSLPPGGLLLVFPSMVCDDDETGPLSAAFLSLYFLCLATGEGRVYPPSSYEEWFREAGFSSLECTVDAGDDAVFIGRK